LGATLSGFTLVLHTWNQRLLFHPHLHAIVPGAGLDEHNSPPEGTCRQSNRRSGSVTGA